MAMSKSMDKQARLRACWSAQETGSYSTMAPPGEEPMQSGFKKQQISARLTQKDDVSMERCFFFDKALTEREGRLDRMSKIIQSLESDFKRRGVEMPWAPLDGESPCRMARKASLMQACRPWDVEKGLDCLDKSLARCELRLDELHLRVGGGITEPSTPGHTRRHTEPSDSCTSQSYSQEERSEKPVRKTTDVAMIQSQDLKDAIMRAQEGNSILHDMMESFGEWQGESVEPLPSSKVQAPFTPTQRVSEGKLELERNKIMELKRLLAEKDTELGKLKSTVEKVNKICALESKNMDLRSFVGRLPAVKKKNQELMRDSEELRSLLEENAGIQKAIKKREEIYKQNSELKKRLQMMDDLVSENKALDLETQWISRIQAKNAFLQERARLAKELKKENEELEAVVQGLTPLVAQNARLRSAAGNPSNLMDQESEAAQEESDAEEEATLRFGISGSELMVETRDREEKELHSPGSDQLYSPAWSTVEAATAPNNPLGLESVADAEVDRGDSLALSQRTHGRRRTSHDSCFPMGCVFKRQLRYSKSGGRSSFSLA